MGSWGEGGGRAASVSALLSLEGVSCRGGGGVEGCAETGSGECPFAFPFFSTSSNTGFLRNRDEGEVARDPTREPIREPFRD